MHPPPPERKHLWLIDIFLYPISMSGLINIGIFWAIIFVMWVVEIFIPFQFIYRSVGFGLACLGYICFFYMECIRDSAIRGTRATEKMASWIGKFDGS